LGDCKFKRLFIFTTDDDESLRGGGGATEFFLNVLLNKLRNHPFLGACAARGAGAGTGTGVGLGAGTGTGVGLGAALVAGALIGACTGAGIFPLFFNLETYLSNSFGFLYNSIYCFIMSSVISRSFGL